MRSLIALPEDPTYLDWYVAIRDKKHRATRDSLIGAHALIQERYDAFAQAIGDRSLENLKKYPQASVLRTSLRACYDGATQPLRQLKQAIREAQPIRLLKYCPMCGTTLPRTFDHYMPAAVFPEFAVHPLNLVPCCSTCNSTKDDDWLCASGNRQFLHAYTDAIPEVQFLGVKLHEAPPLAGVGATFALTRPANMSSQLWQLIDSNFSRLRLIDRYNEQSNDEVAEILSDCRVFLETGGKNVREFLRGRAKERLAVYGANHWIVVLMKEMAKHPKLETWSGRQ